jgi:hypothetical protein
MVTYRPRPSLAVVSHTCLQSPFRLCVLSPYQCAQLSPPGAIPLPDPRDFPSRVASRRVPFSHPQTSSSHPWQLTRPAAVRKRPIAHTDAPVGDMPAAEHTAAGRVVLVPVRIRTTILPASHPRGRINLGRGRKGPASPWWPAHQPSLSLSKA